MTRLAALVLVAGCNSDQGWPGVTGVGNPGSASQRMANAGDMTIEHASVYTRSAEVADCTDETLQVDIESDVDLLNGPAVVVPGGQWCGLTMNWEPPLRVEGRDDEGRTFLLELETEDPFVAITPRFLMNQHALILEIGFHEWVEREDLDLHRLDHVEVDETHPLHDVLARKLADGSGLFVDANGNGDIDGVERAQPLGTGPLHEVEDD